jgi:hypothetical protein
MRFYRVIRVRHEATPRRVSAAAKHVRKEKEKYALFPELVTHKTTDDRVTSILQARIQNDIESRRRHARDWRAVRGQVRALPDDVRASLLKYWSSFSCPGHPIYLKGLLREIAQGKFDPAAQLRELEATAERGRKWRESIDYSLARHWTAHYEGRCGPPDSALVKYRPMPE